MNSQIATATEEHLTVSSQVNQGVNDISDVEQIASASQGVSQLTQKLQSLVGQFHY